MQCMHTITNKCYWDTLICNTITLVPLWLTKRHAGIEVGPLYSLTLCAFADWFSTRNGGIAPSDCTACTGMLEQLADTTHHTLAPLTIHWHYPLSVIGAEQPVNHPSWPRVHIPVSCCIIKGNLSLHTLGLLPIHYHSHILIPSYTTSRWGQCLEQIHVLLQVHKLTNGIDKYTERTFQ